MIRRLRGEEGMALVMAVGMLAVLSLMAATMLAYSSSNARSSSVQRSANKTLDLAEAGFARALSKLAAAPSATAPTLLPGETATLEGGSVTWSGILTGEAWVVTSTSTVKNPANGSDLTKTLIARVQIGIDPSANNAWNYLYADAPSAAGCNTLKNSVVIGSPLFVKGDLCLIDNARAEGALVKAGGYVWIDNSNASIGNPATNPDTYVPELKTAGGCKYLSGSTSLANCTTANRVWATSVTNDPGTLEKPVVDFPYWYTNAKPGPSQACTSSSGSVPAFDNGGGLNRSNSGVELLTASAWSCTVTSGVHTLGKIAWTPDDGDADIYGTLEVLGTIFYDGDLNFTSGRKAVYSGRGTIYASGKITFSGNTHVCGSLSCDLNAWDAEQNLLVLVSGYCADVITSCDEIDQRNIGFEVTDNSKIQGAAYAISDFDQKNSGQMQGPVIAHMMTFQDTGVANKWIPIEAMTMGTPGAGRKLNVTSWAT